MRFIPNWIFTNTIEKNILDSHRDHLLFRAKICCFILIVLCPFTILPYFYFTRLHLFEKALQISLTAVLVFFLIALSQKTKFVKKHYYLPSLALIMTCSFITSASILTERTAQRHFLFPYFLTNFGYATLLPAPLLWGVGILSIIPISYFFVEWTSGIPFGTPIVISNMISLIDAMVLAIIANQILFSLFVRDKRNVNIQ